MLAILALLFVPVAVSFAVYSPAETAWYSASRAATGMAPDPAKVREPVVQVYAARTFGRRGALGVHTWVIVKRRDAEAFTRYDVVGWSGPSYVKTDYMSPDALWYGATPVLLVDRRGDDVEAMIGRIEAAVAAYPYATEYRTWPGPNSNTFVAHIARAVPELRVDLPPTAIGKDYLPIGSAITTAPSGTGGQVSLYGLLGLTLGLEEGVEMNVLGLSLGVDVLNPALRLPGLGRIGVEKPEPRPAD
jgi:Protein of unknown function (DUF3750)